MTKSHLISFPSPCIHLLPVHVVDLFLKNCNTIFWWINTNSVTAKGYRQSFARLFQETLF